MYAGLNKILDLDVTQGIVLDNTGLNTLTVSNVTVNKIGKVYSAYFNGKNATLSLSNIIYNAYAYTISLWVTAGSTNTHIITGNYIDFAMETNYNFILQRVTDAAGNLIQSISINKLMYHILIIKNSTGNKCTYYINGISKTSGVIPDNTTNFTSNLYIGAYLGGSNWYKGFIPKLQIFSGLPINSANFAAQIFNSERGMFLV